MGAATPTYAIALPLMVIRTCIAGSALAILVRPGMHLAVNKPQRDVERRNAS